MSIASVRLVMRKGDFGRPLFLGHAKAPDSQFHFSISEGSLQKVTFHLLTGDSVPIYLPTVAGARIMKPQLLVLIEEVFQTLHISSGEAFYQ